MKPLDKDRFASLKQLISNHNHWWRDERDSSAYEAGRATESYILKLCKETQEVSPKYTISRLFLECLPRQYNKTFIEQNKKNVLFFVNHITKKF